MSDPSKQGGPRHDDIRFETTDVRFAPIVWTAIIGTLITAGFFGLMLGLYSVLAEREATESAAANPRAAEFARTQPPAPRLQARPLLDMDELRLREEASLSGYRWIDRSQGVVKVPIERAMELLVKRGVPAREAP